MCTDIFTKIFENLQEKDKQHLRRCNKFMNECYKKNDYKYYYLVTLSFMLKCTFSHLPMNITHHQFHTLKDIKGLLDKCIKQSNFNWRKKFKIVPTINYETYYCAKIYIEIRMQDEQMVNMAADGHEIKCVLDERLPRLQ